MATMNKDLSPVDQARIILRNYDKVVAERDELKKENERLNMLVEQKDVLYRNMLERMEKKNKPSAIESEYKHLKIQYDKLNEENEKLKGARYTVEVVKNLCGLFRAYSKQLHKAGINISDIEALFDSKVEVSSEMRDWTKFFKRGDVVRSIDDGAQAVFKGWESDDYTSFYASIVHHAEVDEWDEDVVFAVESFYKESEEFARGFIVDAEEHYNGKYNPDTLRVEQSVKPECPFRPFDKVLVRDLEGQIWNANYFSYYRENNKDFLYACMDNLYRYCIPYEGNEHLLGTTDPYTKGGME